MLRHAGADEYVVLLAGDYLAILNRLIQHHQQLARQQSQNGQAPAAPADASDPSGSSSPAESASMAATVQLFRDRVVPVWRESSIPCSTLLQLLRSRQAMSRTAPTAAPTVATSAQTIGRPTAAAVAARAAAAGVVGKEPPYERHLLALDLMTRDLRSPDSYVLTVPGAAAFIKSVTAGRQELLQLLARKK